MSLFSDSEMDDLFGTDLDVQRDSPDCLGCGMYRKVKSPKMNYTGRGKLKCLIIAEGPGQDEDENWRTLGYKEPTQFIGQVGEFFRDILKEESSRVYKKEKTLDLDRDFWKMNAVNCRPIQSVKGKISNREPTITEIECCRPMIDKAIEELKPQFIWLMGKWAVQSFYHKYFKKNPLARWRGLCIPDQKTGAYIIPMYHPSYPQRDISNKNLQALYRRDIRFAIRCMTKERLQPLESYEDHINQVTQYDGVINNLDYLIKTPLKWIYIDYETTGLKPYKPGHKIVSMSITFHTKKDIEDTFVFPYQYRDHFNVSEQRQIKRRIRKILSDKKIPKIAQNYKFEHIWGKKIFGIDTDPWLWDTMLGARVQDNRQMFSGLKFQTYVNFGILPYDRHVNKYLKSGEFNRIMDIKLNTLLLYNGYDTLYGSMLFKKQQKAIKGKRLEAYNLFHEATVELMTMEWNGIPVDEEFCHSEKERIKKKQVSIIKDLLTGEEAEKFKVAAGRNLSLSSTADLSKLFFEVLGHQGIRSKKSKLYKVDAPTLEKLDIPFVKKLLEVRKLEKISGTYLSGFMKRTYNDKMHPSFDLIVPVSLRGSSSDPNFQNIPNRDEEAQKATRQAIVPSKGNRILEGDFSSIEVGKAACITGDSNLIKYVTDPSTDMHRDTAADIWILKKNQITKLIRFYAKNGWVFPQFYGSWYKECAHNLWYTCVIQLKLKTADGIPLREHLAEKGIKNLEAFKDHCAKMEKVFWYERFNEYRLWKEEINREYRKKGYIETPYGFRFSGLMEERQVANFPMQGTAFHSLLWTLKEVGKISRKEEWKTKVIGQIHDSGVFDMCPDEQDHVIETINYVGTKKIRETYSWITVPLEIEFNVSEIDGNWSDTKEVKI